MKQVLKRLSIALVSASLMVTSVAPLALATTTTTTASNEAEATKAVETPAAKAAFEASLKEDQELFNSADMQRRIASGEVTRVVMTLEDMAAMANKSSQFQSADLSPTGTEGVQAPIGDWRFYYNFACVKDFSYGAYPPYFHTAANAWSATPNFKIGYGVGEPACSGYPENTHMRAFLVPAASSGNYASCGLLSGTLNENGYWISAVKIYHNYYRSECHASSDWIGHFISQTIGVASGLKTYTGSFADVMNLASNQKWPSNRPPTGDIQSMELRYNLRPGN
jgi:hypothetical protein